QRLFYAVEPAPLLKDKNSHSVYRNLERLFRTQLSCEQAALEKHIFECPGQTQIGAAVLLPVLNRHGLMPGNISFHGVVLQFQLFLARQESASDAAVSGAEYYHPRHH